MKKLFIIYFLVNSLSAFSQNKPIAIAIHGGAGYMTPESVYPEKKAEYETSLQNALNKGYMLLQEGKPALDVVQEVIRMLEEDTLFNAGRGAVLTAEGKPELDASIMCGATGKAGAVAGVSRIQSPIHAAAEVMEKSPHVLLVRTGAERFYELQGNELISPDYFILPSALLRLKEVKKKTQGSHRENTESKLGTVGCVALDQNGNLAAGTSTGGMMNKLWGRVGDSPIVGSGTWANNATCAVSCTGHGEYFMRLNVAHDVHAQMKYAKKKLKKAVHYSIHSTLENAGGKGGLIALDAKGNVAIEFNTPSMLRAWKNAKGESEVKVFD